MSYIFNVKTTDQLDTYLSKGNDINSQNYIGQTLLHKAIIESNDVMIDHILKQPGVKWLKDINGKTPIYYCNNEQTVEKLMVKGAPFERSVKTNVNCQKVMNKVIRSFHN